MLPNESLSNYIFPNDAHILWSWMIVIYPYITGLIAGAFIVSALYHVFKIEAFRPIARFALVAAFCFGLFAGVPLLVHLGQPQRAFNIFFTPHLSSAMSIFGYVYSGYMVLLVVELWLTYRPHFIQQANRTTGLLGLIWNALTLGIRSYTPESARVDQKSITVLAAIGIPWAFLLHGYVGFIFGSVKANAWWATPLQPIIFLLSAIVSGMAMLLLMYSFILWRRRQVYDYAVLRKLAVFLWGFFVLDFAIEMLEVVYAAYEHGHHWTLIGSLLSGPLFESYVIGQVLVLSVIPLLLLGYAVVANLTGKPLLYLANLASLMLVLQVLFMRFNVVVGGQMLSKSYRGFVDFDVEVLAKEGILVAAVILAAPFVVYFVLSRLLPILDDEPGPAVPRVARAGLAPE
jgi:Ni/Fe-hydrogenase subunit HybB-like protein